MSVIATPFWLMWRPFAGYRELGAATETPSIVVGAGRFFLAVGALVAVSATGRFAPIEGLLAMVSFSWLPLVHSVSIAVTTRLFAPRTPWRRAVALYFEGIGPWLVLFLVLVGGVLFMPHPERPQVLFFGPLVIVAFVWSVFLSYALFRAGIGLARGRAALATFSFWVVSFALILGYFLAAGQLWPIL